MATGAIDLTTAAAITRLAELGLEGLSLVLQENENLRYVDLARTVVRRCGVTPEMNYDEVCSVFGRIGSADATVFCKDVRTDVYSLTNSNSIAYTAHALSKYVYRWIGISSALSTFFVELRVTGMQVILAQHLDFIMYYRTERNEYVIVVFRCTHDGDRIKVSLKVATVEWDGRE